MDARHVVDRLAALAQESRLRIFRLLVEAGSAGRSVGEIGASLHVSPATLSFHLKELARAGLIVARQEGRFIYYSADYARMNELVGFLTENCCAREGAACAPLGACGPAPRGKARPATRRKRAS